MKAGEDRGEKVPVENSIRDFKKKGYLLSGAEVERMKEEIRQRCKLPVADEKSYPWYYHYELGLAMERRNDWQRALDSFINALDDRDQPKKFSRIYGMWYVDYYPYYNIGLAHYHLKNWECAANSFKLSTMLEDLPKDSSEYQLLQKYKSEIEKESGGNRGE
jgi:tetratricopeptide (TPR) repeat protein